MPDLDGTVERLGMRWEDDPDMFSGMHRDIRSASCDFRGTATSDALVSRSSRFAFWRRRFRSTVIKPIEDVSELFNFLVDEDDGDLYTRECLRCEAWCRQASCLASTHYERLGVATVWMGTLLRLGCARSLSLAFEPYLNLMDANYGALLCTANERSVDGSMLSYRKGVVYLELLWLRVVDSLSVVSTKVLGAPDEKFDPVCAGHAMRHFSDYEGLGRLRPEDGFHGGRAKHDLFQRYVPHPSPRTGNAVVDGKYVPNDCEGSEDINNDYGTMCRIGRCQFHCGLMDDCRAKVEVKGVHGVCEVSTCGETYGVLESPSDFDSGPAWCERSASLMVSSGISPATVGITLPPIEEDVQ